MKFYPIHTHYLPASLHDVEIESAIISIELNAKLQNLYYQNSRTVKTIRNFLHEWNEITEKKFPLQSRPYFALEGETDLHSLHDLHEMYALGLVSIQIQRKIKLTPFFNPKSGLTPLGKHLLRMMDEIGIFLDLSHLNGQILKHILDHAPGPRVVSHVVCRDLFHWSLTTRANSMSADELLACSAQLYGVPFVDDLVSPHASFSVAERKAEVRHVAEHIVRLAEIVGPERVALGPDYFDYASIIDLEIGIVPGLDSKEGLWQLQKELKILGISAYDIEAIFWANAARVLPPAKGINA